MNQKQILAKYQETAKALHKAQEALKQINGDWHNWSSADAGYYADQIAELLSCDHGEAGMETLIARLEQM